MSLDFDVVRVISILLSLATIFIIVRFWLTYPQYHLQFFLILFYLAHGLIFYTKFLIDKRTPTTFMTGVAYNDWGSVLRFHSFATWFFVALLYFRARRPGHGR